MPYIYVNNWILGLLLCMAVDMVVIRKCIDMGMRVPNGRNGSMEKANEGECENEYVDLRRSNRSAGG